MVINYLLLFFFPNEVIILPLLMVDQSLHVCLLIKILPKINILVLLFVSTRSNVITVLATSSLFGSDYK